MMAKFAVVRIGFDVHIPIADNEYFLIRAKALGADAENAIYWGALVRAHRSHPDAEVQTERKIIGVLDISD
jgi:hypothetical protein